MTKGELEFPSCPVPLMLSDATSVGHVCNTMFHIWLKVGDAQMTTGCGQGKGPCLLQGVPEGWDPAGVS